LGSPQKFKRLSLCSGSSYEIKNYAIEVTFNGMSSHPEFHKNLPITSNVYGEGDRHTAL
jgi:hypothetical protein